MSKVTEILEYLAESYYPEHEYGTTWQKENAEKIKEAERDILAWAGDVIGKDEPDIPADFTKSVVDGARNELRAEQRKRAGL